MPRLILLLLCAAIAPLAGCRSAATVSPGAVAIPVGTTIPEGTPFGLRIEQRLGLGSSGVGNPFRATVVSFVMFEEGTLVVPTGTEVFGTVTGLAPPDGPHPAAIRLAFDRIRLGDENYLFRAAITRTDAVGADTTAAGRGRVLIGAPLDALVRGTLGPGSGTTISLGTDLDEAALPIGTVMSVTTERRIVLR